MKIQKGLALVTVVLVGPGCSVGHKIAEQAKKEITGKPQIESDRMVEYVLCDVSGSLDLDALQMEKDRTAGFCGLSEKPQIKTTMRWFARSSDQFYVGATFQPSVQQALDRTINREEIHRKVPKPFFGSRVAESLSKFESEIAAAPEVGKKPRLHVIYIYTDGGLTDSPKDVLPIAERLAKHNVLVVVAGLKTKAGTVSSDIVDQLLKPLVTAQKLERLYDATYDQDLKAFVAGRLNPALRKTA